MARPIKQRKILSPYSDLNIMRPGNNNSGNDNIMFLAEEFESIKLIDYEGLNQSQAARLMKVSRPTFTRIYKRARIKISTSLVENRALKLSGENIYYSDNWHKCNTCGCIFNAVEKSENDFCSVCKNSDIINIINPN